MTHSTPTPLDPSPARPDDAGRLSDSLIFLAEAQASLEEAQRALVGGGRYLHHVDAAIASLNALVREHDDDAGFNGWSGPYPGAPV